MRRDQRTLETFHNRKRLMEGNRFLSNKKVFNCLFISFSLFMYFAVNYLLKYLKALGQINKEYGADEMFLHSTNMSFFDIFLPVWELKGLYVLFIAILVVGYIKFYYQVQHSYDSMNVGQNGTSRVTTREEIEKQYKKIPDRGVRFKGKGGLPVARDDRYLYIDDSPVNNLIIGITRSGKGEMIVFPLIDIYSRAEQQASMVLTDPKLELAQASIPRLTALGYECHILNLIDPEFSMGYNPLTLIIEEYKNGDMAAAEQLTRAFCYSIYSASEISGDKFWSDNSTSLLTALILASIEDNLRADDEENAIRLKKHKEIEEEKRNQAILELSKEDRLIYFVQETYKEATKKGYLMEEAIFNDIKSKFDLTDEEINEILNKEEIHINYKETPFEYTHDNEKKINLYSIISTFTTLANEKIDENTTELDKYFFSRDENNKARIIYGSIGLSGDKTKGSIYSSMLTGLNVFTQTNIAKMTAKSTFDINKIGFGKKPVAIFIGLPDYDKSNHFIGSVFIKQLYYTLAKLATASASGKCYREVIFILDEFGNMPAIEGMDNIITVCLGRNIRFNMIIQSYAQIINLYGQEQAKTISGNAGNHVYILTNDIETADEFAKRVGTETITDISRSGKYYELNKNITENQRERLLIDGEELKALMPGEMIVSRIMKRDDLAGESVRARAIFNLGEYKMLYRYQYLIDYFPSGQQLYESPNIKRVNTLIEEAEKELKENVDNITYYEDQNQKEYIKKTKAKKEKDKTKYALTKAEKEELDRLNSKNLNNFKVEDTKSIVLEERIWSADKYLSKSRKRKQAASEILSKEALEEICKTLYLTNSERNELFSGEIKIKDLEQSGTSAIQKGYKTEGYKTLEIINRALEEKEEMIDIDVTGNSLEEDKILEESLEVIKKKAISKEENNKNVHKTEVKEEAIEEKEALNEKNEEQKRNLAKNIRNNQSKIESKKSLNRTSMSQQGKKTKAIQRNEPQRKPRRRR